MAKRRVMGKTWWGERWLDALQDCDFDNRLPRGKTYYNQGHLIEMEFNAQKCRIEALVDGSQYYPYEVTLALKPIASDKAEVQGGKDPLADASQPGSKTVPHHPRPAQGRELQHREIQYFFPLSRFTPDFIAADRNRFQLHPPAVSFSLPIHRVLHPIQSGGRFPPGCSSKSPTVGKCILYHLHTLLRHSRHIKTHRRICRQMVSI